MKPALFIATPTTRELVSVQFCMSLCALVAGLARGGVSASFHTQGGHDVAQQRDELAAKFLASKASHLLLIDDDMKFAPADISAMLGAGKDLIAAACPLRVDGPVRFNVEPDSGPPKFDGSAIRVKSVGAGIMLISRRCFDQIAKKCELATYKVHASQAEVRGFFDRIVANGEKRPEDWSFCDRYRAAGGEVWAYPSAQIGHVGTNVFVGRMSDHFVKPKPG